MHLSASVSEATSCKGEVRGILSVCPTASYVGLIFLSVPPVSAAQHFYPPVFHTHMICLYFCFTQQKTRSNKRGGRMVKEMQIEWVIFL